jgi:hypothetical protein
MYTHGCLLYCSLDIVQPEIFLHTALHPIEQLLDRESFVDPLIGLNLIFILQVNIVLCVRNLESISHGLHCIELGYWHITAMLLSLPFFSSLLRTCF